MSKKILVYKDESAIQRAIKCIETFTPELIKIKEEFEQFTKESFSNEAFKTIVQDKGQSTIENYINSIKKELDKIGITNEITREGLLKSHDEIINNFRLSVKSIIEKNYNEFGVVRFDYITFQKSKFVISDEELKRIEESNSVYLESKEEIELYNQLKETFETLERTKDKIEKTIGYKLPEHLKTIDLLNNKIFKEFNSRLSFYPKEIKTLIRTYKQK